MGCSAACIEQHQKPLLLIDCGPGTLAAYQANYGGLPNAIFMTHAHMDHIADLEILTVRARLQEVAPITFIAIMLLTPATHSACRDTCFFRATLDRFPKLFTMN